MHFIFQTYLEEKCAFSKHHVIFQYTSQRERPMAADLSVVDFNKYCSGLSSSLFCVSFWHLLHTLWLRRARARPDKKNCDNTFLANLKFIKQLFFVCFFLFFFFFSNTRVFIWFIYYNTINSNSIFSYQFLQIDFLHVLLWNFWQFLCQVIPKKICGGNGHVILHQTKHLPTWHRFLVVQILEVCCFKF